MCVLLRSILENVLVNEKRSLKTYWQHIITFRNAYNAQFSIFYITSSRVCKKLHLSFLTMRDIIHGQSRYARNLRNDTATQCH